MTAHHTAAWAPTGTAASRASDHTLADQAAADREFACLVDVAGIAAEHLGTLRRLPGVVHLVPGDTVTVRLITASTSRRAAQHDVIARITGALPGATVTLPRIVDYDAALLAYLDHRDHGPDQLDPYLDDGEALALILDRA